MKRCLASLIIREMQFKATVGYHFTSVGMAIIKKKRWQIWWGCGEWGTHVHRSVQFRCSVVSDSLRLHESQHARPPCSSPTPGVHSDYTHTHLQIHMSVCTCPRFCFFDWTMADVHSIWISTVFNRRLSSVLFDPSPISHAMSCRRLPLVVTYSGLHLFPVYISTAAVPTDLQTWVHFEDVNNLWMQAVSKKHFPKCIRIDLYPHWTWQISALRRLAFSLHSLNIS